MHPIQVHKVVALMISFFYLIGFWHRGDKPTAKELRIKLVCCIWYTLFILALMVGAVTNDREDRSIFLAEMSVGGAVVTIKLWLLTWKQNEILDLLDRVCVFSIQNDDDYKNFNDKIRGFTKAVIVYGISVTFAGLSGALVLPFLASEKILFFEIWFPLDWKSNEIAFWIATFVVVTGVILTIIVVIFSTIIWYLLLICSLRYEVLGSELKNMGRISERRNGKATEQEMRNNFLADLKASIGAHLHLRKLTVELGSYFSNAFFIQFGTSGLSICGSIYCLAFNMGDNLLERLIHFIIFAYFIAELFMITYFGNEIKLSSDRLSYSLFESNWIELPQATKKCIIIFGEYLKQPHELLVGKLYPLTLETFTRILKSAYSMFNILKSFQQ